MTTNDTTETTSYRSLTPWKLPSDYGGATWYGWYAVAGQSRDSDALERSNYKCIFEELRKLDTELLESDIDPRNLHDDSAGDSTVTDTRCGHWAVGWVETIYVHSSNVAACERADEILNALSDYPVFDESDMSETEHEDEQQSWDLWARHDFERRLSSSLESWLIDRMDAGGVAEDVADARDASVIEDFENMDASQLANLFYETADAINEYWVHESSGATIDVDRVADSVDIAELFALLGETEAIFKPALFCRFDPFQLWLPFVSL